MQSLSSTIREVLYEGYRVAEASPEHLTQGTVLDLLARVTGREKSWLMAHREGTISESEQQQYLHYLQRASEGEPVAYIIGTAQFFDLELTVTPDVLIPRPETEELVSEVLEWCRQQVQPLAIVDVGTGSGAIAIMLARELPEAKVYATDISQAALQIAEANANHTLGTQRIAFLESDLLTNLPVDVDVIVANLPYIAAHDLPDLEVAQWEPVLALDGGPDGLDLIQRLLGQTHNHLRKTALIALEIGYDQGVPIVALCEQHFPNARTRLLQDFAGQDRLVLVDIN